MTKAFLLKAALVVAAMIHAACLPAQTLEQLKAGIVKVTSQEEGKRRTGTGFIVRLDTDAAYIVTASHVVEGDPGPEVEFFTRQNAKQKAEVLHIEGGDARGLALLAVRGKDNLASGLAALQLAREVGLDGGEEVTAIGFPQGAGPWAVIRASITSRDGRDLTLTGEIDEGNSGGPLLKQGKVVGVVTGLGNRFARATPAAIVDIVLQGWGIRQAAAAEASPPIREVAPASGAAGLDFRVVELIPQKADPVAYQGVCPIKINFAWKVSVAGGGKVTYQILRSDGVAASSETIAFEGAGSKDVTSSWTLGRADAPRSYSGWQTLKILAPNELQSERIAFSVDCKQASAETTAVAVKISRASCQPIGSGNYKVDFKGEAQGPPDAALAWYTEPEATTMNADRRCGDWEKRTGASQACSRGSTAPAKTAWSTSLLLHTLNRPPTRVTASVSATSQDGPALLAKDSARIYCR